MEEVLARGRRLLEKYEDLTDLPSWVYNLNFEQAELQCDLDECGEIVTRLRDAEHSLREGTAWDEAHKCADTPTPRGAADEECAMRRMLFAATRLALGAAIEAANAKEASIIAPPGARKTDVFSIARLYNDAFLASVWTSAHAMYISQLQNGFEEPSTPGLFTVPNAYSIFDLNDLFARRTCPRQCPKGAQPLLHVLMRSTWNTLLESALAESMACRVIVGNAVTVALSAMHPHLHPAFRPPWQTRMSIQTIAANAMSDRDSRTNLVKTALPTKEAVRRLLSTTMVASPAMFCALQKLGHPVGLLHSPPVALPAKGMEGAMVAFVYAGMDMNDSIKPDYIHSVTAAFEKVDSTSNMGFSWDVSWLG